ncbi:GAF domain-containing protein [Paracoccus sp. (in: a-proteobacteria)]|uniref:GAF domain-containing protein n=1 Tax=Paracoccus sp. TaxID=267 RepID=UPI0026DF02C8|nr:GAF domain-containing protein [Paracoccus sp. (in: a-proteobacteria)]MDO5370871.1 hypothetical protein [Paracoccus sp. (in: a-proteobacteria)]
MRPLLGPDGQPTGFLKIGQDVTAQRATESALRAREARQAFLLQLADALRPRTDPDAIQGEAARLLAERLDVGRACYVEVNEGAGLVRIAQDHVRDDAPSLAGEHPLTDFAWSVGIMRSGECHGIADTRASSLVPAAARPASAALGIIAWTGAPLIKEGRLVAALCVTSAEPR